MEIIRNKRIPTTSKAGLKAELIFYSKFGSKILLEPLLDAGVKADFTGKKNGRLVNFDVTTNIEYKDIDKYVDVIQKRKKTYEIVHINLKSEEILFYPLRFPICRCGRFSHYILYLEPPMYELNIYAEISDTQILVQYCSNCNYSKRLKTYHYLVPFFSGKLEYLMDRCLDLEEEVCMERVENLVRQDAVSVVKFFEKTSNLLISGVTENVIKDEDDVIVQYGNNYQHKELHWKHPLARELKELRIIFL
jgi:hypothetical protein